MAIARLKTKQNTIEKARETKQWATPQNKLPRTNLIIKNTWYVTNWVVPLLNGPVCRSEEKTKSSEGKKKESNEKKRESSALRGRISPLRCPVQSVRNWTLKGSIEGVPCIGSKTSLFGDDKINEFYKKKFQLIIRIFKSFYIL